MYCDLQPTVAGSVCNFKSISLNWKAIGVHIFLSVFRAFTKAVFKRTFRVGSELMDGWRESESPAENN